MLFRVISFAAICAVLVFFLHREEKRGGLNDVNRLFLDWLVANSSEQIQEPELTFVRLTDNEARVFESWPPSPLDYAVILKNLERYEPGVIMIAPTLGWRLDDEITTGALRTQLLRAPRLLLGAVLQDNPVPSALPPASDPVRFLAAVSAVSGDISAIPQFTGLLTLPEEAFLPGALLAFTHIDLGPDDSGGVPAVPLLARRGELVVPSFVLTAILIQNDREVDDLVVRLGDTIEITGTDIAIPIDERGYLSVFAGIRDHVPRLDAGALFLADETDIPGLDSPESDEAALDTLLQSAVLIGIDHPGSRQLPLGNGARVSRAELLAIAVATIQSRRYIVRLPAEREAATWVILVAAGMLLLRFNRARIFGFSLLLLMLFTIFSLFLFQSRLAWLSPAIPVALTLATAIWGLILPGHGPNTEETASED